VAKNMNENNGAGTNHGGGVISRDVAYRKTAAHFDAALAVWVKSLSSRNEAIALGAANKIIDKCLPDIKSVELTGENGEPIKFNLLAPSTYFSAIGKLDAASTASAYGRSAEVQGTDLAPESPENNNGNQSVSTVEST
jgi:hypothetical protein